MCIRECIYLLTIIIIVNLLISIWNCDSWIILYNRIFLSIYCNCSIVINSLGWCLSNLFCLWLSLCCCFLTILKSCCIYYLFLNWTIFCSNCNCCCIASRVHSSTAYAYLGSIVISGSTYNKLCNISINSCIVCCPVWWKCWWKRSRTYLQGL